MEEAEEEDEGEVDEEEDEEEDENGCRPFAATISALFLYSALHCRRASSGPLSVRCPQPVPQSPSPLRSMACLNAEEELRCVSSSKHRTSSTLYPVLNLDSARFIALAQ
jgi:hypothetical protein